MKNKIILMAVILLSLIGFSCKKVDKSDPEWIKTRLAERIEDYQKSLIKNKLERVWELSFQSKDNPTDKGKENFMKLLGESNHMATYYKTEYKVDNSEIRGDKAKVMITYLITPAEGEKPMPAGMYDFWQFKDGDWYFVMGGKDQFYTPQGWW